MKQEIFISLAVGLLFAGYAQAQVTPRQQAQQQLDKIQTTMKANRPGTVATSATGYTMRAKVNGKSWVADAMLPPKDAARILGYHREEYIGLQLPYSTIGGGRYISKNLVVGKKTPLVQKTIDFLPLTATSEDGVLKGEMEITKVTSQWVEGKFFYTSIGNKTGSKRVVTDGFFRFPYPSN